MSTTGSARVMTPAQFIAKWSPVTLSERAASRGRFIDLARLLPQATPTVLLRRRSSVVVHHVANVNVVGSNLIARFYAMCRQSVTHGVFLCQLSNRTSLTVPVLRARHFANRCQSRHVLPITECLPTPSWSPVVTEKVTGGSKGHRPVRALWSPDTASIALAWSGTIATIP